MSATSGPLDDQIAHEYSDVGRDGTAPAGKTEGSGVGPATKPGVINVDAVRT